MFAGRVEAKYTVPSATTVSATNSGGGPTSVTMTAGAYFMTAAGTTSGGISTFQSVLNSTRAPSDGAWTVSLSTGASGDGRVTIDCTSGAKLTKSGGVDGTVDAGANVTTQLTGDGFVEMTVGSGTNSTRVVMGLAAPNSTASRDTGYYFELVELGDLWVRELGVDIGSMGTWAAGDVLRVRRTGTTITYEKNGAVIYTSLASLAGNVIGDFALRVASSYATGIRLWSGTAASGSYQAVAWSNSTNVTATATTFSLAWTSTTLRDLLGFTADITTANTPQTGTKQAKGLWRPDCPLSIGRDPRMAPLVTDLRTTQSPTGQVLGLTGNSFYRHKNVLWSHVPIAQVRESSATYANASYEQFLNDTQFGRGHTWFSVSSPVQIYDHSSYLVGLDLNSGAGTNGWSIIGLSSVEPDLSVAGWTGLFKVQWDSIVSSG